MLPDRETDGCPGYHFKGILVADVPVVLLHGYPLNQTIWRHQTSLESLELVVLDLPGFGESPMVAVHSINDYADWARGELHKLGHGPAIWIGHSMGGYITLALARNHPESVLGMGLICTQARSDTEDAAKNRLAIADRVLREGVEFIAESMPPKLVDGMQVEARAPLVAEIEAMIRSALPAAIVQAQRAMATREDQRQILGTLQMPAWVAYGAGDQLIASDRSEEMASCLPNVRVEEFESSGHMAMMEEPDRFNAALTEFAASIRNS